MKLVRLRTTLYNIRAQLGLGNVLDSSSSYSTATRTTTREVTNSLRKGSSMYKLYRMLSPMGDPNDSMVPLLDQWVEEGRPLDMEQLRVIIKRFRLYKRFSHALQISMWMTKKSNFVLTPADVAIRLDLIAKVQGIEQAANYFNCVPEKLKLPGVYIALLNAYAYAKSAEKAEIIMQQMRDRGLVKKTIDYNSMMNVYYQTGNYKKLDSLMHEMEEKGIDRDKYTFSILLSAYAAASDGEGIDKIVAMMEADRGVVLDWTVYATAASGYVKAGLSDKALAVLRKSEVLTMHNKFSRAYDFVITQYAACGNKGDVLRVWKHYKQNLKVYNRGYICVISSLLKFDGMESAEKIFEEWESCNLSHDIRIPNHLIDAYCRRGLLHKAETLIYKAQLRGTEPNVRTWYLMATGYLQNNQSEKGVEAMKKALVLLEAGTRWKPSKECLAACLGYYKKERDIEGADYFIKLLTGKEIISADLQDRLLNNIRNGAIALPFEPAVRS
ncbi:hypothetical protein AB3S75_032477 [Citrus x aurantiifolia]